MIPNYINSWMDSGLESKKIKIYFLSIRSWELNQQILAYIVHFSSKEFQPYLQQFTIRSRFPDNCSCFSSVTFKHTHSLSQAPLKQLIIYYCSYSHYSFKTPFSIEILTETVLYSGYVSISY